MTPREILARWASWAPQLRSVLRVAAAFMFMWMSEPGLGGALEVFGGGLVLLGLFTRPVAFLLAGEMAVAYFQFHFPKGFWPTVNGGMSAALYCFVWLYFSAAGAGPWSLDARRGK